MDITEQSNQESYSVQVFGGGAGGVCVCTDVMITDQ